MKFYDIFVGTVHIKQCSVENTLNLIIFTQPLFNVRSTVQGNLFTFYNAYNQVCLWITS